MSSRKKQSRRLVEPDIILAAAELKEPPAKPTGKKTIQKTTPKPAAVKKKTATTKPKAKRKRPPLPGGASFPSFQLPSPKSPTFYEDSIKTMGSLRRIAKQCMGYMQKADQWIDHLHGFGTNLHQAGVLPKIAQGKVKDLSTSDWTTLLMALMNSPFAGMILGGLGNSAQKPEPEAKAAEPDGK